MFVCLQMNDIECLQMKGGKYSMSAYVAERDIFLVLLNQTKFRLLVIIIIIDLTILIIIKIIVIINYDIIIDLTILQIYFSASA